MTLDPNAQSPDEYPTDAGAEARAEAEAERAAPEQPAAPPPEQPRPGMGDARRMMPNDYPQAPQPQGAYSQQPRQQESGHRVSVPGQRTAGRFGVGMSVSTTSPSITWPSM